MYFGNKFLTQPQEIMVHGTFKNIVHCLLWKKKKSEMFGWMQGIIQKTFNREKMNISNIVKDKNRQTNRVPWGFLLFLSFWLIWNNCGVTFRFQLIIICS